MDNLCDIAAERAILSGLAQYGQDALVDISDILSVDTLYHQDNKILFKCIKHVLESERSIDLTTILSGAAELGLQDFINQEAQLKYVRSIFNFPIKLENVREHAKKLAKLELARKAQSKHKEAYEDLCKITGTETVDEILQISNGKILDLDLELNGNVENTALIGDDSKEFLNHLATNPVELAGLPTPFPRYNQSIGGLRVGGVNLICARPKCGKSFTNMNIGYHLAKLGIPVLDLNTEMSKNEQLTRLFARSSGVSLDLIETGKFSKSEKLKTKLNNAIQEITHLPYYFRCVAGKEFEEILSIIRRWIHRFVGFENGRTKNCLVVYDYFKLMNAKDLDKMAEFQALGFQISRLTDFAKEYQFPCLAFVQVNRDGMTKDTSDIVAQSDRLLWLCHSLTLLKRKTPDEMAEDGSSGNLKLIPLESRFGKSLNYGDYININFRGDIALMEEGLTRNESNKEDSGFTNEQSNEE